MDRNLFGRRTLLCSTSALFGALVARWLSPLNAAAADARPGKARACILLWLNGGPSHIDTFDPKPGRPTGGPFKAIKSRVPGLMLSEHLPRLAERGDKLAVVRSMSSKEGNHGRAQYYVHTSYAPNPTVVHPSLGGWIGARLGDRSADLPAFVSIGGPSFGAGFLGVQNGPFVLQKAGAPPADVGLPRGVDLARFERRRAVLDAIDERFAVDTGDARSKAAGKCTQRRCASCKPRSSTPSTWPARAPRPRRRTATRTLGEAVSSRAASSSAA